jgi:hypothetical protein
VIRAFVLVLSCAALGAWAQDVQGPDLRDVFHSRSLAMGGAFESLGYGADVASGNPAAMSIYKRYQIEASGSWDIPHGFGLATLALADSTNWLAAGAAYQFVTYGAFERRWAHLTTGAFAVALADWLHLGFALRHQVLVGASSTNSMTANAGFIFRPTELLSLGFSGHNLVNNFNRDITRYFVASVSSQLFGQLSPAFDLRMDFNQPMARFAFLGGLEWLISQTFPLRIGYSYDGITNHQHLSFGVGYFLEGSGIDFSYRHELGGAEGRMLSATLKMQL